MKLPPIRQRKLNLIYGDWYAEVCRQRMIGKSIQQIAAYFTEIDGVSVAWPTLAYWIRNHERSKRQEKATC